MILILLETFTLSILNAGGYKPGDKAGDFRLKNVDGKFVSLSDYKTAKGFVVVFTCNHCPYAQAYQERLISINNKYRLKGFPVIAINPNDPAVSPGDSYEEMQKRAGEMQYTFPYLFDETQAIYKMYGAERTPHVYLLKKEGNDFRIVYIGAIDNNYKDPSQVTEKYLENAIEAVLSGKSPEPDVTKAIGCSIKAKKP
ncbi:MAG: thioredoxin family protein [Bacteroidales bacterium]|nr:thioredoxin family protein [Bacteroidales bacterium]